MRRRFADMSAVQCDESATRVRREFDVALNSPVDEVGFYHEPRNTPNRRIWSESPSNTLNPTMNVNRVRAPFGLVGPTPASVALRPLSRVPYREGTQIQAHMPVTAASSTRAKAACTILPTIKSVDPSCLAIAQPLTARICYHAFHCVRQAPS